MDINNFLDKFVGDWFSQRTTYHLPQNQVDNAKANVTLTLLTADDSKITQLANQYHFNLDLSLGAFGVAAPLVLASSWDNSPDWGKPKQTGESLMLIFRSEDDLNKGNIVRITNSSEIVKGEYVLAEDESLILRIIKDDQYLEERINFASDNLRLRNTIFKHNNQVRQTCFYSEIKRVVKKED
ncbi:phycobiliprotein lyase [Cyanobacterium aponinum UTEX 3222]|uniref:phycobiliprotein lyase n=1 Tax=Cyanobacterium aponinum TaxID=379064 RepID=UPI002B4BA751|nr:phycobiliprotein lyase [Cyanobacterium aponinum]WRL39508.1 phycobiliprotein lyase [Cyanobacterium aponinum UTEX 3221]WRL42286.1 phycobiliprotein lyase [Cyanobacterium aponinum UTEX 3222]